MFINLYLGLVWGLEVLQAASLLKWRVYKFLYTLNAFIIYGNWYIHYAAQCSL